MQHELSIKSQKLSQDVLKVFQVNLNPSRAWLRCITNIYINILIFKCVRPYIGIGIISSIIISFIYKEKHHCKDFSNCTSSCSFDTLESLKDTLGNPYLLRKLFAINQKLNILVLRNECYFYIHKFVIVYYFRAPLLGSLTLWYCYCLHSQ